MAQAGMSYDPAVDYYAVLDVKKEAEQKEIRKAYRKLAQKYHPDANQGDREAEERFKEISAAYDVIGDPDKRKEYDDARMLYGDGPRIGGSGFRVGDIGDMFGDIFATVGGNRRRQPTVGPRRGQDLEAEIYLAFRDAVEGVQTAVHLTSEAPCAVCFGSGAAPGTSPRPCNECGGRGVQSDNQGFFGFSRPCSRCRGSGQLIDRPCATCDGSGIATRPRQITVKIPAGVGDGGKVIIRGKGGAGARGGPPGDLFLTVNVEPDKHFERKGNDIALKVPVTFPEAVLGAQIEVPTIRGETVKFRVPAGSTTGKSFRLKGYGGPDKKGGRHDMVVSLDVTVPQRLSKAEQEALERFAAVHTADPRAHLRG